ncbi:MAG: anthranilate synthase component I [Anaerolineae bacterium]|nr:MAG: anthranilate synthase component I [Anaerolineae bacterium]
MPMVTELIQTTAQITPIVRRISADLDTPASVYLKVRGNGPSFLLESVQGGERVARYSFIGIEPRYEYRITGRQIERRSANMVEHIRIPPEQDLLHYLQSQLAGFTPQRPDGLPRFIGGLVGYLGYETVRYFEPKLHPRLKHNALPEAVFLLADTILAFDHARHTLDLITYAFDGDIQAANSRLDDIEARLRAPLPRPSEPYARQPASVEFLSNLTRAEYEQAVRVAKEHIAAGDIFQVVLSQRLSRSTESDPFDIYRALRRLNPSPYMYFFDFGDLQGKPFYIIGASPEIFVRLEGRKASLRPIAGTRPRGADRAADEALAAELLADPKERAEHIMLVDLGRNDLGRVCEYGTVRVPEFFTIERYSHVMHIVSHAEGILRPDLTAFDLVRATFPAGTVSGAPKVRAMEIIADLEPDARGPYAGAIGYFSFDGNMDTCIAIRTLVGHGQTISVQAGAGIVADSDPSREYEETLNKARAVLRAVEMAEQRE